MRLDLSSHAVSRMVELGVGEDVVAEIVGRPSVRYPSPRSRYPRGDVFQSAAYPAWAIVADPPTVITVLRREADRWEHDSTMTRYASTLTPATVEDTPGPNPPGVGRATAAVRVQITPDRRRGAR